MRRLLPFLFLPLFLFCASPSGTSLLEKTSTAFTEIADKAMPATVFLKVKLAKQSRSTSSPFDPYSDEFFRRFFGSPFGPEPDTGPQLSGGSGFLISPDGLIVTNNHVVENGEEIIVVLNDGKEYPATVKGSDPRSDIALVQIDAKDLPYLSFGNSDSLRVGEWVVAIGNPFGLEATLTVGVVSAKGRQDIGITSYEDFIQTDAAINPGNSGGPLLNLQGEVVGVNTAIFSKSGGYMGIGFSIPSRMAEYVVDQLQQKGNVQRAYLGIIPQPIDKNLADAQGLDTQDGILVADVLPNSPAAQGGLQSGDIILAYNGKSAKNPTKFRNDIGMMQPGSLIQLKILREGKIKNLTIPLGSQTDTEALSTEILQKIGVEIETLTPDMATKLGYGPQVEGVVITKVQPNSPAALAGLRPSFLITGVAFSLNQQKKIGNVQDFQQALEERGDKKHIILIVRHQNVQRYYTLKLG